MIFKHNAGEIVNTFCKLNNNINNNEDHDDNNNAIVIPLYTKLSINSILMYEISN